MQWYANTSTGFHMLGDGQVLIVRAVAGIQESATTRPQLGRCAEDLDSQIHHLLQSVRLLRHRVRHVSAARARNKGRRPMPKHRELLELPTLLETDAAGQIQRDGTDPHRKPRPTTKKAGHKTEEPRVAKQEVRPGHATRRAQSQETDGARGRDRRLAERRREKTTTRKRDKKACRYWVGVWPPQRSGKTRKRK